MIGLAITSAIHQVSVLQKGKSVILCSVLLLCYALHLDLAHQYFAQNSYKKIFYQDLQSDDVLLRLTALENIVRLADSCAAYTTLKNLGIFKGIGFWLATGHPDAMYTGKSYISVIKKDWSPQHG